MRDEPITRIMTASPTTVSPDATIDEAERVMREHACHHVPVVEADRLVGMLSASDLLKALVLEDEHGDTDGQAPRVATIMRRKITALPQTATLLDAARALASGAMHALPIIAPNGAVTGIVTSSDLIETLVDRLKHPVAPASSESPPSGRNPTALEIGALRAVYRAAVSYLESGRGDLEHGRLLQAVDRVREALEHPAVQI